jgi:hypothetical protein
MVHILQRLADWLIEREEHEAENCAIPDEIIAEWYETLVARLAELRRDGLTETEEYRMLEDLRQRVRRIQTIRERKCHGKAE